MHTVLLLLVSLALAGSSESRSPSLVADDVTLVSEPHRRQDNHRIASRSSAGLFTAANAGLVIPYAPGDSSYGYMALSLAALGPRSLARSRQPLKPVYHATPLQPYGSLLDTSQNAFAKKSYIKPIVEKPQEGPFNKYLGGASVGHLTEAILPRPTVTTRQIPVVYKSHSIDHAASFQNVNQDNEHYAAKYQFGYQVRDPKGGNFFGHSEARDGDSTKGQYHVFLPDGRLQHVQYWADPSGYHAEISYNRPATQHNNAHHV